MLSSRVRKLTFEKHRKLKKTKEQAITIQKNAFKLYWWDADPLMITIVYRTWKSRTTAMAVRRQSQ